jgi:hypothetical protein
MYITFAMGTLGALLGVWIAWSQSPIVVTVLPLLFGVIGGAGGYSLLKMDFSKPQNQEKIRVIGLGFGTLCLACLIFMITAMIARPFLREFTAQSEFDITGSTSPLRALTMRARLQILGATGKEIRFILKPQPTRISAKDQITSIEGDAKEYIKAYDTIAENDRAALEVGYQEFSPKAIAVWCKLFLAEEGTLSDNDKNIDQERAFLLIDRLSNIKIGAAPIGFTIEAQQTLSKYPTLLSARIKLMATLQAATTVSQYTSSTQEIEQADAVIKIMANSPKKDHDPLQLAISPEQTSR